LQSERSCPSGGFKNTQRFAELIKEIEDGHNDCACTKLNLYNLEDLRNVYRWQKKPYISKVGNKPDFIAVYCPEHTDGDAVREVLKEVKSFDDVGLNLFSEKPSENDAQLSIMGAYWQGIGVVAATPGISVALANKLRAIRPHLLRDLWANVQFHLVQRKRRNVGALGVTVQAHMQTNNFQAFMLNTMSHYRLVRPDHRLCGNPRSGLICTAPIQVFPGEQRPLDALIATATFFIIDTLAAGYPSTSLYTPFPNQNLLRICFNL